MLFFVASGGVLLLGCDRAPSVDSLREWTPSDHHSTDDDKIASGQQTAAAPQARGPNGGSQSGANADQTQSLVDLTWRTQCTSCHGVAGRGDGPMGGMLHAPDLTRADWQGNVTDAAIAATIKGGKDKMPKFDLPDPVVQGLVARIRLLKR
jgi:mono/diheme cytochrome c family protein